MPIDNDFVVVVDNLDVHETFQARLEGETKVAVLAN
jgi:hypothetical protein